MFHSLSFFEKKSRLWWYILGYGLSVYKILFKVESWNTMKKIEVCVYICYFIKMAVRISVMQKRWHFISISLMFILYYKIIKQYNNIILLFMNVEKYKMINLSLKIFRITYNICLARIKCMPLLQNIWIITNCVMPLLRIVCFSPIYPYQYYFRV